MSAGRCTRTPPTPAPAQANTRYARFRGHPQKQKNTQNDSKDFPKIPPRRTDNKPGPSSPCYPSFLAGSGCQDHPKIAPRPPLRQPKSNQDTPQEGQITSLACFSLLSVLLGGLGCQDCPKIAPKSSLRLALKAEENNRLPPKKLCPKVVAQELLRTDSRIPPYCMAGCAQHNRKETLHGVHAQELH